MSEFQEAWRKFLANKYPGKNPQWIEYVVKYNCLYHDYGLNEEQILGILGPEPEEENERRGILVQ